MCRQKAEENNSHKKYSIQDPMPYNAGNVYALSVRYAAVGESIYGRYQIDSHGFAMQLCISWSQTQLVKDDEE